RRPLAATRLPYTTLFRSVSSCGACGGWKLSAREPEVNQMSRGWVSIGALLLISCGGQSGKFGKLPEVSVPIQKKPEQDPTLFREDRKSTRLNSSHVKISY